MKISPSYLICGIIIKALCLYYAHGQIKYQLIYIISIKLHLSQTHMLQDLTEIFRHYKGLPVLLSVSLRLLQHFHRQQTTVLLWCRQIYIWIQVRQNLKSECFKTKYSRLLTWCWSFVYILSRCLTLQQAWCFLFFTDENVFCNCNKGVYSLKDQLLWWILLLDIHLGSFLMLFFYL